MSSYVAARANPRGALVSTVEKVNTEGSEG
jgi:hypothetical protein